MCDNYVMDITCDTNVLECKYSFMRARHTVLLKHALFSNSKSVRKRVEQIDFCLDGY